MPYEDKVLQKNKAHVDPNGGASGSTRPTEPLLDGTNPPLPTIPDPCVSTDVPLLDKTSVGHVDPDVPLSQGAGTVRPKISSWRQFKAILRKDIVMELRTKEMITSMGLYALLVLIIYYVALSQAGTNFDVSRISAGLLLLAIVFTSMLGLNRSLVHEQDQGQLDALLLSPIDRPILFLGKAVTNFIFLAIVEVIITPLFYFIFMGNAHTSQMGPLWMVALALLLGSIGIAGVGTLLATMSVNTKGKDFVLAVIFIPLMFPLLLAVVTALNAVILGNPDATTVFWRFAGIAFGYDVITIAIAWALYEFILGV